MTKNASGIVTAIQRCSIHDGPGLRTTVFLKGCPLRCVWCHNPECISPQVETLWYPEQCIGCGQCHTGCFAGARVVCGQIMTAEDVMKQIRQDAPFYGKDGGVTLSGGEPLLQLSFAQEIISACHRESIGVAVETSLCLPWARIAPVLADCDLIMADLKAWQDDIHVRYTKKHNTLILENFHRLGKGNIPVIMRTPVIPGVNATPEEIHAIASFAGTLDSLQYYELLPYHPLGLSKAKAVDGFRAKTFERPSPALMQTLAQAAAEALPKSVMIAGVPFTSQEEALPC